MTYDMDFNDANQQQLGDLIPNGTLCKLAMKIMAGGAGPEGWLTKSKTSDAVYLNCEFTVVDGPFARRKLWQNMTFSGGKTNDKGQSIGGEITRSTLRAILESFRGINPGDMSEKAVAARRVSSFMEFDGMEFAAKIGVEKGQQGYGYKNKIAAVVTPDKKEYREIMSGQYQPQAAASQPQSQAKPEWAQGQAMTPPPQQTKPTIPSWAQ